MRSKTQRSLLFGFIASIACCGLVGIYCFLIDSFGRFEERILVSTITVAGIFMLGLAAAVPAERRTWHPVGFIGLVAPLPALFMTLFIIWYDSRSYDYATRRLLERWTGVCWVIAVTFPHLGLLSLTRLKRQWTWVRTATVVCVCVLAAQIIASLLNYYLVGELWGRAMGILTILVVCGSIVVPILHRVSAIPINETIHTAELTLNVTCPRCAKAQVLPLGRSQCGECGLKFMIEIEEETCRSCGYPLYKIKSAVCPECGTSIIHAPATPDGSDSSG